MTSVLIKSPTWGGFLIGILSSYLNSLWRKLASLIRTHYRTVRAYKSREQSWFRLLETNDAAFRESPLKNCLKNLCEF